MSTIADLLRFVVAARKFWLAPVLFVLVFFGGLMVLTQGSAIAPFIYTLF